MKIRFRLSAQPFAFVGLLAGFAFALPSAAQEVDLKPLFPGEAQTAAKAEALSDMDIIHVTDRLINSAEGQKALLNYFEARDAGLLRAGKGGVSYDVGDEKSFNVLDSLQVYDDRWTPFSFVLRSTNDVANVWIEKSLDASFSEENLAELDEHMLRSTPQWSFRPDRGIIENNNYLFGDPPNYDGDGKVDILVYDVVEGKPECCVLGYVTSTDINPAAKDGEGNQADVLYVDLPDGFRRGGV